MKKSTSDILTRDELAVLLGIRPRTLRQWRKFKWLPHAKISRRKNLYRREEIHHWLDAQSTSARG